MRTNLTKIVDRIRDLLLVGASLLFALSKFQALYSRLAKIFHPFTVTDSAYLISGRRLILLFILGMIHVNVTVSNKISELRVTNQIRAIQPIRAVQSTATNSVVNFGHDASIGVEIFGGAYGDVSVSFHDGDGGDGDDDGDNRVAVLKKYFSQELDVDSSTVYFKYRYQAIL